MQSTDASGSNVFQIEMKPTPLAVPLPLAGRGWGWGDIQSVAVSSIDAALISKSSRQDLHPTPTPARQGEGVSVKNLIQSQLERLKKTQIVLPRIHLLFA